MKFLKHDVIIFHTLDHQEINLDYDGLIQFEDLESKDKMQTFPQSVKQTYRQAVNEFLEQIAKTAGRSIYYYNDATNPNPASPPAGTLSNSIPNLKIYYQFLLRFQSCWALPNDG